MEGRLFSLTLPHQGAIPPEVWHRAQVQSEQHAQPFKQLATAEFLRRSSSEEFLRRVLDRSLNAGWRTFTFRAFRRRFYPKRLTIRTYISS